MRHAQVVLACVLLLALSVGCTSQMAGGQKVLKFRADDDEAFANAPSSGTYVVAYRQVGANELWPAKGTRRKVKQGEELGFTRDDAGQVIAVAGAHEKVVGTFPVIAHYACWYRLPDNDRRDRNVTAGMRDLPALVAGVALLGAAIAVELALLKHGDRYFDEYDADNDDGWSDHPPKRWHKHHHDR